MCSLLITKTFVLLVIFGSIVSPKITICNISGWCKYAFVTGRFSQPTPSTWVRQPIVGLAAGSFFLEGKAVYYLIMYIKWSSLYPLLSFPTQDIHCIMNQCWASLFMSLHFSNKCALLNNALFALINNIVLHIYSICKYS